MLPSILNISLVLLRHKPSPFETMREAFLASLAAGWKALVGEELDACHGPFPACLA